MFILPSSYILGPVPSLVVMCPDYFSPSHFSGGHKSYHRLCQYWHLHNNLSYSDIPPLRLSVPLSY